MALATAELLGVGNTAEVFAVTDTEAAWLPYDWGDFARLTSTASQLVAAGFDIKIGAAWHEGVLRSCALFPRATGPSLAELAPTDDRPVIELVRHWMAEFSRVGLSFVHFEPKHILRYDDTYLLTGLPHAYDTNNPPQTVVRNWGPFSPIGDQPLCFWPSGMLMQPAVTALLSAYAASACCSLIANRQATDIVAASVFSSTAAQIKLSLTDPPNDPASVQLALDKIVSLPTHELPPPHITNAALKALALDTGCCHCFNI